MLFTCALGKSVDGNEASIDSWSETFVRYHLRIIATVVTMGPGDNTTGSTPQINAMQPINRTTLWLGDLLASLTPVIELQEPRIFECPSSWQTHNAPPKANFLIFLTSQTYNLGAVYRTTSPTYTSSSTLYRHTGSPTTRARKGTKHLRHWGVLNQVSI